jgi:hypothetical protein
LPVLLGSVEGVLKGEMSIDLKSYVFTSIDLEEEAGRGDGRIEMVFSLYEILAQSSHSPSRRIDSYHSSAPLFEPWIPSFTFSTNQGVVLKAAQIKATLNPFLDTVREHQEELDASKEQLRACSSDISRMILSAPSGWLNGKDPYQVTEEMASRVNNTLTLQFNQMQSSSQQTRPVVKRNNNANPILATYQAQLVGCPVDLAYVNDKDEALILSWASSNYLDALVFRDTDTASILYRQSNLKTLALDQTQPYRVGNSRSRNEEELRSCLLPLPPLEGYNGPPPRYMINMLKLDSANENLRDSLFWHMFSNTLLFDDFASATTYRKILVQQRRLTPSMYTLTGERLMKDALFTPGNKIPKNLSNVYGEQNLSTTDDYNVCLRDLKQLEALIPLLETREELQARVNRLLTPSNDVVMAQQEIDRLQQELDDLGMGQTRVQTQVVLPSLTKPIRKRSAR